MSHCGSISRQYCESLVVTWLPRVNCNQWTVITSWRNNKASGERGGGGSQLIRLTGAQGHTRVCQSCTTLSLQSFLCFCSCRHRRYISWKRVIEHNYVVLWVKFTISCWFHSDRRTEDIFFFFACTAEWRSRQFVFPPASHCRWRQPHLTTCHIWRHKSHLAEAMFLWWNGRKSDSAASLWRSPSTGHLVLLSVWGGFLSLQSSPHRDVGFIQGVGPCDSWWQEVEIMLILYGTVNPLLRPRRRCQVYLRCVLAASPQHQARCMKKGKKKECRRETMSLLLPILQFSLQSFFSSPSSLLHLFQSPHSSASLLPSPSKQNHATLSDLICSSLLLFLLFHKRQPWHPGVSVDGVFRCIGRSDIYSHAESTQHAVWERYF